MVHGFEFSNAEWLLSARKRFLSLADRFPCKPAFVLSAIRAPLPEEEDATFNRTVYRCHKVQHRSFSDDRDGVPEEYWA